RKPETRARILSEKAETDNVAFASLLSMVGAMFDLGDPPNYEPDPSMTLAARAQREGVTPEALAYDLLLGNEGRATLCLAIANYADFSLEPALEMMKDENTLIGLGDGGAHYGMICDASYPTFLLAHWARDRSSGRFSVPEAVRELTSAPARVAGLGDRGRIAVGYKADLNVIDHAGLRLHKPVVTYDLPAGGRRLDQTADGYVATVVSGQVIAENGVPTDARPGKLVRGRQPVPS
ncbi:MAG: amidohydrolase family protein, partial [Mycobacterium sp.]|nr:amidohydrolase family protein [Mycobacterium sp.]